MRPSVCVMVGRAPYGLVHAAEGVRHVGGALNEGFDATLLLVGDGVWVARKGQDAAGTGFTSLSEAVQATMERREGPVARVAVHAPSLRERGLAPAELLPGVELVDDAQMAALIASAQQLLRF